MYGIKGLVGGLVGGVIGALVWAGISYGTGYEIGWIAWGIGGLVGIGCVKAAGGGGMPMAVMAAILTVFSLVGGKYAAIEMSVMKHLGTQEEATATAIAELQDDEMVISYLADSIIETMVAGEQEIQWPGGEAPEEVYLQEHYPKAIWANAESQWRQMRPEEQAAYRGNLEEMVTANVAAWYGTISGVAFLDSFSPMDLLFFGLAVVTAFQIVAKAPPPVMRSPFAESEEDPNANIETAA